jgi:BirA family biotin operon repressor/biotin-[acetyl-CoA-carboxylase] ligase
MADDIIHFESITGTLLSRNVRFLPECPSTNDFARELAKTGEPEGLLVITDYQTAGRGRLDRSWRAPAGSSLLFSLLLRPPIAPVRALQAAMAVSLGVIEGVRSECGLPARLKWPNDILIDGKKVGGILCELGLEGDRLEYIIVGVGLNVNFDPRGMEGIPTDATSLLVERGRPQPRTALLRAILAEIEPRYRAICRGESLRDEWARALETLGRRVRVTLAEGLPSRPPSRSGGSGGSGSGGGTLDGTAESVEESGGLILRLPDGTRRTILAGDVVNLTIDNRP